MALKPIIRRLVHRVTLVLLMGGLVVPEVCGTTFLYKQYVVKQDLGLDILCEPYQVQPDDWVYKIFRRKGEIAEDDFPHFIQIFQRINPHIQDLDRIQVGERILIPLRKMAAEDASAGEAVDDLVTLPFVTISNASADNPAEAQSPAAQSHTVEAGDTIHRLIATQFGPPGSEAYEPALARLKALNPDIQNLDKIYVGQVIQLPAPDLPIGLSGVSSSALKLAPESSRGSELSIMDLKPLPKPPGGQNRSSAPIPLATVAGLLGGEVSQHGKFHFPAVLGPDVVIDTARSPILNLPAGGRLLISPGSAAITPHEIAVVRKHWPDLQVLSLDPQETMADQLAQLLRGSGAVQAPPNITVKEPGLTLTLRVNWIIERSSASPEKGASRIGLALLTDAAEQTPPAVQRYLAGHGVVLREIVLQGSAMQLLAIDPQSPESSPARTLPTGSDRNLILGLLRAMGFTWVPNSQISFSYAGMELSAWADMVQDGDGEELLLNFGQIQGEAVDLLKQSGLAIVNLHRQVPLRDRLVTLFQALDVSCTYDPVFWAAARPATYNTSISASGLLASPLIGRQFLITPFSYSASALQIFQERGIQVIQLALSAAQRKSAGWG
ncbi:MAG: LysM peptidoglycan-binding domain-containing protein [Desulfobacterales bacterium]